MPDSAIFLQDLSVVGLKNSKVFFNWFGAKADGVTDNAICFINLAKFINSKKSNCVVEFGSGVYTYKSNYDGWRNLVEIVDGTNISYVGNETTIKQVKEESWNQSMMKSESPIQFRSSSKGSSFNIKIKGLSIIGDNVSYIKEYGDGNANGLSIRGVYDVIIDDCVVNGWSTDGIYIGTTYENLFKSNNVTIKNCNLDRNTRQGISVAGCDNVIIEGCYISNTGGGSFGYAIDLEANPPMVQYDARISNCMSYNNEQGFVNVINTYGAIICGNNCKELLCNGVFMADGNAKDIIVANNKVDCKSAMLYYKGSNVNNVLVKCNIVSTQKTPANKATIRLNPFNNCTGIKDITISDNIFYGTGGLYNRIDGVLTVKNNTFNVSAMDTDGVDKFNIVSEGANCQFIDNKVVIDTSVTTSEPMQILIYNGDFKGNILKSHENAVYQIFDDRVFSFLNVNIGNNDFSEFFYYKGEDNRFDIKERGCVSELVNISGVWHRIVNGEYARTTQGKNARVNDVVFYKSGEDKDAFYMKYCVESGSPGTWIQMQRFGSLSKNGVGPLVGTPKTDLFSGKPYFCQDKKTSEGNTNGIMIFYNEALGAWVDALGRVVE